MSCDLPLKRLGHELTVANRGVIRPDRPGHNAPDSRGQNCLKSRCVAARIDVRQKCAPNQRWPGLMGP
jgi:hypothetical protein